MSPQKSRSGLVAFVALGSLAGLPASAEVVLSSGSSCSVAWGPGGLQDERISESIDAIPFSFTAIGML